MDPASALQLARKHQISIVQIVREEYEMILLSQIIDSPLGKKLVFRGGTALRLAYHSLCFSDDLDFSQLQKINFKSFKNLCSQISQKHPYLKLEIVRNKYFTLFALFKITDPVLSENISIKIEISTRKESWKTNKDYSLMKLSSETTPITSVVYVASLDKIEKEKLSINPPRVRDIFDLWYIGQITGKLFALDFHQFKPSEIDGDLKRLLSKSTRNMLEPYFPKK